MAYVTQPTWVTGQLVTATCLTQYSNNDEYLKGRAGSIAFESGAAFSGSALVPGTLAIKDTSGNQRLLMGNSGGVATPVIAQAANGNLFLGTGTTFTGTGGTLTTKICAIACAVFIGAGSTNANNACGLTIHQGGGTDEALALKATNVAHGVTAQAETDTFGVFKQRSGGNGGLQVIGYYDSTANDALVMNGVMTFAGSAKDTGANGFVRLEGNAISGGNFATPAANANIVVISAGTGVARVIVDAEGDIHGDAAITASAYDAYNDVGLVRALELFRAPETTVREVWDEWVQYSRADLERLKIATFNDHPGGDGSIFVNYSALTRLHSGALWQMHKRLAQVERATAVLIAVLDAPSRVGSWVAGVGRRLLGRRDGGPPARRR